MTSSPALPCLRDGPPRPPLAGSFVPVSVAGAFQAVAGVALVASSSGPEPRRRWRIPGARGAVADALKIVGFGTFKPL